MKKGKISQNVLKRSVLKYIQKEDTEMLSDMIVAAYNAAHDELEKFTEQKLGKYQAMLGGSFF